MDRVPQVPCAQAVAPAIHRGRRPLALPRSHPWHVMSWLVLPHSFEDYLMSQKDAIRWTIDDSDSDN